MNNNPPNVLVDSNYFESKEVKECRQFINDLYVSNSGENMKFVERIQYIIEPKSIQVDVELHYLAEEAFGYKYENLVKSINQKISESNWKNHEFMRYFKPESVIQVGQKLENLTDLEKLSTQGKNFKCNIEEGKVYLIYIWTIYKPICKKQLSWLNEIFIRHNWENNAKFICINTDSNREYADKLIKLLHIDHIESLYVDQTKYPNHPIFNITNKYGYPTSILVNNESIIELCGSLFEVDLEKKIECLLKRERASNALDFYKSSFLNENEISNLELLIKKIPFKVKEKIQNANANHLYGGTLKIKKIFTAQKDFDYINENNPSNTNKIHHKIIASLDYYAHTSDIGILDYIFEGISNIKSINIIRNPVSTYEIQFKRNPICCICKNSCCEMYLKATEKQRQEKRSKLEKKKKNITKEKSTSKKNDTNINKEIIIKDYYEYIDECSNDSESEIEENESFFGYYYCSICNENYCLICGSEITDVAEPQNMHKHFLFYLHNNNRGYMKYILKYNNETNHDLDFKYFFENSKTEVLSDIASHYQVKCDACQSFPIRSVRWKCCNCVSKNICDECKNYLENKDPEHYEDILWNLQQEGCDPLQHVFMKVLFDCFAY